MSKAVGLAIVGGSAILKLPQIMKILSSGSVDGISSNGYYLETITFMNTAGFSMANNVPFSVYGESVIITGQNFIVILMIWAYNKSIGFFEKLVVFALIGGYGYALFNNLLTPEQWDLVTSSSTVLGVLSKMPQIISNWQKQSTG